MGLHPNGIREFRGIVAVLLVVLTVIGAPVVVAVQQSGPAESGSHEVSGGRKGAFLGGKETVYPDWFKDSFLDFSEDVREAASQGKRVLLLFHQDNCPYCNALIEKNLSQKPIETLLKSKFDVVALNMWGDREVVPIGGETFTEKKFAEALKVQFTPTLIFLNEQGQTVLRLNGYLPPRKFRAALDYVAGKLEAEMPFRDYYAKQAKAAGKGGSTLHEEPFFARPPYDLHHTGGRPVAVFFEQRDCPACDRLHERVLADATTRKLLKRYLNVQLDMWSDQPLVTPDGRQTTARRWAKKLNVFYAPSILLFNEHGEEVIRAEAMFKRFHTQSLFDYVASGAYKQQPNFQRYISDRADRIREQGIDVNIWE